MALSNRDRIGKAVELLGEGLMAFVDSEMTAHAPAGAEWLPALAPAGPNPNRKVSLADPQLQLKVLWDYWNPVFSRLLGQTERTMVSLLRDARDRWAHNESFSYDEAYRCLDAAQFLLQAVSAGAQAEEVRRAKDELQRSHYEEATRKAARTQGPVGAPTGGLPAWREVVVPHADVAAGTFAQAEFAADLAQVARGEGAPEYSDPVEFFRRTFLTEGLRQLLAQALGRLGGDAGVPVVDLQTNFGGGKTHSLLALYHLFSGVALARLPQEVQDLAHGVGLAELPAVRMAVLVGTAIAPGQPVTKPDGTVVRTLWGELAWQLGGPAGFGMVAASDAMGTSPGAALCTLFATFGPALVLIDEWVAYARQLYGREDLPAGSFDAHFSFAQALTEAARATKATLVVVSIPASDPSRGEAGAGIEVGGSGGREALARLRNVVGRMESAWRPASATESFEIVRRRLFEPIIDPDRFAARDAVVRAFGEFYRSESSQFPTECREGAYVARMRDAYPIHPELFARLYEDWSALERFQRTRGVLRLMAAVIHTLWHRGDRSALILPGSVPLDDGVVLTELTRHLEDNWRPIVDADIDGPGSLPAQLDQENPATLGRYFAARRVARSVFLGSAPTLRSANRGLADTRVRLGSVYPGEPIGTFADALRRLSDQATYLYVDGPRYWYDTAPSVTRIARDRAARYADAQSDEVGMEIRRRLREDSSGRAQRGEFGSVHIAPTSSAEVPDEDTMRLVILAPEATHIARSSESKALSAAGEILERRGSASRLYKNMIAFLAPDHRRADELVSAVTEYLAWSSIKAEKTQLNLDPFQEGQVETKTRTADDAVRLRLGETYQWLLAPVQPDPSGEIAFDATRVGGQGSLAVRASAKMQSEGQLNVVYSPAVLRLELDRIPLWQDDCVSVGRVWEDMARYVYLQRLRDRDLLARAAAAGPNQLLWESDGFALAEAYDDSSCRYVGLATGGADGGTVPTITATTLLVKPAAALRQRREEEATASQLPSTSDTHPGSAGRGVAPSPVEGELPTDPVPTPRPRRFHGSARVDPQRLNRDVAALAAEIVQHLTALVDAQVEITLEIQATSPDGFSTDVVRTVSENARTLGLPSYGFEER